MDKKVEIKEEIKEEIIELKAGCDIGNGYVKGVAQDAKNNEIMSINMPSCVAYVTQTHDIKTEASDVKNVIDDIFNKMDVTFDSPLVKDGTRRFFGERGIQSGFNIEEFDMYGHVSKAKQDLSGILILGCAAGAALQDYYKKHQELPVDVIKVSMRLSLALPIREYKKYRKEYAENLKATEHWVTFHNFVNRIRVKVTFEDVQVLAEGQAAQYAVNAKGEPFMNALLSDVRKMGMALEGITAKDLLDASTTIGIDIGEGTVNFPVFQNRKFNADISTTLNKGYGSVLENVLERLRDANMPFNSRKELADYIQKGSSPMTRAAYNKVTQLIEEESVAFVKDIKMDFVRVLSKVGPYTEIVYVYGGGATPIKEKLYPILIETVKDINSLLPILYLDSRYSRFLNREGLFLITQNYAEAVANGDDAKKTK